MKLGDVLRLVGIILSNPEVRKLIAGLLPTILVIAKAVQDRVLEAKAQEQLKVDIDAIVNSQVRGAVRARDELAVDPWSVESDPENRDGERGAG